MVRISDGPMLVALAKLGLLCEKQENFEAAEALTRDH